MNKVDMVAEVEVIHLFNNMDFQWGLAWLQLLMSSRYASSKDKQTLSLQ